jgi:hypothetical protein
LFTATYILRRLETYSRRRLNKIVNQPTPDTVHQTS